MVLAHAPKGLVDFHGGLPGHVSERDTCVSEVSMHGGVSKIGELVERAWVKEKVGTLLVPKV